MLRRGTVYQIRLPDTTAGIIVEADRVVVAAPVLFRLRGMRMSEVRDWVGRRGGVVEVAQQEEAGGLR